MRAAAAVGIYAKATIVATHGRYSPVFDFSFVVTAGDASSGIVTGEIFGLTDNATSAATDIVITSMPSGGPDYVPAPPIDVFASLLSVNSNVFTVSDGEVTSGKFNASFGPEGNGYVQSEPGTGAEGFPGYLSFWDPINPMDMWSVYDSNTAAVSYSIAPDVPEPSSIAVVGIALLGLAMARRRDNSPTLSAYPSPQHDPPHRPAARARCR